MTTPAWRQIKDGVQSAAGLPEVCRPEWQDLAACRGNGVDAFFPKPGPFVEPEPCRACPVKMDCLRWALENRIEHGTWGGKSERWRRRVLRPRAHDAGWRDYVETA